MFKIQIPQYFYLFSPHSCLFLLLLWPPLHYVENPRYSLKAPHTQNSWWNESIWRTSKWILRLETVHSRSLQMDARIMQFFVLCDAHPTRDVPFILCSCRRLLSSLDVWDVWIFSKTTTLHLIFNIHGEILECSHSICIFCVLVNRSLKACTTNRINTIFTIGCHFDVLLNFWSIFLMLLEKRKIVYLIIYYVWW